MIDQMKNFRLTSLVDFVYQCALVRHSDLHTEYAQLQHRLPIPAGYASFNAQSYGHLDFLIRSLEDEFCADIAAQKKRTTDPDLSLNILSSWSEMWIIGVYELLRSVKE